LPIPLVGFANLAHMGAYHYMPSCFVKLSFKFKKKKQFNYLLRCRLRARTKPARSVKERHEVEYEENDLKIEKERD